MVGASLGCALGNKPFRIAIVEAHTNVTENTPPSYDDRAIALSYGSAQIFRAMGLWQDISPYVTAITKIHVSDRGHWGMTRINSCDEKVEALGYVITARTLGKILYQYLDNVKNIDFIRPARVSNLKLNTDAAKVTLDLDGQSQTLHTRLIVAADGDRSSARNMLGITTKEHDYQQTAIISNLSTSKPHNNVAYERFTCSGPLALLPMTASPITEPSLPDSSKSSNRCSLVWTQHNDNTDDIMALDDAAFLKKLQHQFGTRLGRFTHVGKRASYPLRLIEAKPQTQQRFVLIGNAAHTLHPIAGQGFNLGMRDVATLAQIIMENESTATDIGNTEALSAYQLWRKQDHRRIIGFTNTLVRVFSNRFAPLSLVRNVGLISTDICPPLKHLLAKHSMGLAGKLPRLARGLPL
ncbi:MAG: 2-octaprenyl-6-methoxyphenyl hydroxylase [Gammaproteobacteria bacterium]|nr:2-octaprenyl-6-methoxyphenyl hydroxylase [Gammaproteobacteria bacterium]